MKTKKVNIRFRWVVIDRCIIFQILEQNKKVSGRSSVGNKSFISSEGLVLRSACNPQLSLHSNIIHLRGTNEQYDYCSYCQALDDSKMAINITKKFFRALTEWCKKDISDIKMVGKDIYEI